MYRTKQSPTDLLNLIYKHLNIAETLSPFRDGVLSNFGIEFASFYVEKFGRIKVRTFEYKILNESKVNYFIQLGYLK